MAAHPGAGGGGGRGGIYGGRISGGDHANSGRGGRGGAGSGGRGSGRGGQQSNRGGAGGGGGRRGEMNFVPSGRGGGQDGRRPRGDDSFGDAGQRYGGQEDSFESGSEFSRATRSRRGGGYHSQGRHEAEGARALDPAADFGVEGDGAGSFGAGHFRGGSRGGRGGRGAGSSFFRETEDHGRHPRVGGGAPFASHRMIRERELERLEEEVNKGNTTSNELLLKLVDGRSGFDNLVDSPIHSPRLFGLVVQLTAKALEENYSPELKLKLLSQLLHSKLFTQSLEHYKTQFPKLIRANQEEWQTIAFVLQIFSICFDLMPKEAFTKLQASILVLKSDLSVFKSLYDCPSYISDRLDELEDGMQLIQATQLSLQMAPVAVAAAARAARFREPPNNFRELSNIPTPADLAMDFKDVFIQANIVKGSYPSAEAYLDTQFRLMREDMVQPLRRGLNDLKKDQRGRRFADIRVYNNVRVLNMFFTSNDGIAYAVLLDSSSPSFRRTNWSISKRLIYGSLVCLSCDNFETLYFATVQDRRSKEFEMEGVMQVLWVNQPPEDLAKVIQEFFLTSSVSQFK